VAQAGQNRRALTTAQRDAVAMPLDPDPRWQFLIGGVTPTGVPIAVTAATLEGIAAEWAAIVADVEPFGGTELLAGGRRLVELAWFDYDQLVTATLKAFQAVEAAFRQVLFPDAHERASFRSLVDRAEREGVVDADRADVVRLAVDMRNYLSHPAGDISFTLGMAAQMVRVAHLVVRDVCLLRGMTRPATSPAAPPSGSGGGA
jgi:hypothetical protein